MSEQQESAPPRCASGCGFFGNPATLNLCSLCFRNHCLVNGEPGPRASSTAAETKAVAETSATVVTTKAAPPASFTPSTATSEAAAATSVSTPPEVATKAQPGRCATCKRKVGLTGFACRCGATYCGAHRNPEKHACTFDFKGAGRDAIARANPLIKGDKLVDKI